MDTTIIYSDVCPNCGGRLEVMPDGALQCDTCDTRYEA